MRILISQRILLLLYIISVLINLLFYILWFDQIKEQILPFIFSSVIIPFNLILTIFLARKDLLAAYLLAGTTTFVQIIALILILFSQELS